MNPNSSELPHIVHLTKYYPPYYGGVPGYVELLAKELKSRFRVTVLTASLSWKRWEETDGNLRVIWAPRVMELRSTALCPTMPWELRKLRPDIVHLHLPDPMAHMTEMLAKGKSKVVISWHSDIVRQRWLLQPYRPFLSHLLARVDRVVVSYPGFAEDSEWLSGIRDRCVTIPFGLDLKRFELSNKIADRVRQIRERFGERIVLFIGRFVYYKGLSFLLEAMRRVEGRLLIVGVGPLEGASRRQVADSGVGDRVEFLGAVPDDELIAYLHACALLVLPSIERSETFGIVQLEAMACRKPVVSTRLPTGVPWVNQHERTGLVVAPRNSEELAAAIERLLDSPALRCQYGEAGRRRVEEEFSKDVHLLRISELYESLLGGGGVSSAAEEPAAAHQAKEGR